MVQPLIGRVHGNVIELEATVPPLEGQRVLVLLEAVDEPAPSPTDQRAAWEHWVAKGPQGPIEEEEGEEAFP